MATSSFKKDFKIKTERELDSVLKAFEESKPLKINKKRTNKKQNEEGVERFLKQFSHLKEL